MTIEDKISQFLPSFLKRYDGNKDSADEGTLERYQKMLASEIDEHFLESTDNLHENTKAVTMPVKFLPYEEDLRGTLPLVFEFAPIITLDETNLVFDFDFKKTSQQTLRDGVYLTAYSDRGVNMVQSTASTQPTIDTMGLKFDGVDDFMTLEATGGKEIWLVCNNLDGAVFNDSDGLLSTPLTSEDYIYVNRFTTTFRFPYASMKINNIAGTDFAPLANFKTISQLINNGNTPLEIGVLFRILYWNGYIKRILIFDEILSEQRRTTLQEFLAYTYSL